jgi:hypothetical protein
MPRLVRLDRTGHTTIAEWRSGNSDAERLAIKAFERERENGMLASFTRPDGDAEVVRELPLDADLVVMRRPIVGG